jgi:phosphatidate phosphatase PAH1
MAADSYANIRQYAISLYELMLSRNEGISKGRPETETMIIYVDKANLQSLMNVPGCDKIAFVIGQEKDKATIGLLCADNQNRILPAHIDGELDGQEVWDEVAMGENLTTALP